MHALLPWEFFKILSKVLWAYWVILLFQVFRDDPDGKCVYIAPLKALVRERISDWKIRFEQKLGKKVVELTGDITPDVRAILQASVIVTTPEKWDAVSRSWQTRSFVQVFFWLRTYIQLWKMNMIPLVNKPYVNDLYQKSW